MNKITTLLLSGVAAATAFAQPASQFSMDTFDDFTLHTYASFDAMADVSFIVETANKLVVIEPQAFEGKVEEFMAYTEQLDKPIDKVLVSFHAAGLKVYGDEHKVITQPMAAFMQSPKAQGMLGHFDQAFKGAMDTEIVEFDETIDATTKWVIDGVEIQLEPTSVPGMPGVNIAIGGQVYYQHFSPAKGAHASKNQISSMASIDGALIDAMKAKIAGYTLLLGSHGAGKATVEDLDFQIAYLSTMKSIAATAQCADEFKTKMLEAYPACRGAENIGAIAGKLFAVTADERAQANKAATLDFIQLIMGERNYEEARKYVAEYIQHGPTIEDGYDALITALETEHRWKDRPMSTIQFVNVVAEGDLVIVQMPRTIKAKDDGSPVNVMVVHTLRFNDQGKIAEHWSVGQSAKLKDSVSKHPLF